MTPAPADTADLLLTLGLIVFYLALLWVVDWLDERFPEKKSE